MGTALMDPLQANVSLAQTNTSSLYPGVTATDGNVISALIVDTCIGLALFVVFLLARRRIKCIYSARCDGRDGSPVEPDPGLFGWLTSAMKVGLLCVGVQRVALNREGRCSGALLV